MSLPKSPLMCQPPFLSPGSGGLGAASKQTSAAIHPSQHRPSVQPKPFISTPLLPPPQSSNLSIGLSVLLCVPSSSCPSSRTSSALSYSGWDLERSSLPPLCLWTGDLRHPWCSKTGCPGSPPSKKRGLLVVSLCSIDNPRSGKFFLLSDVCI